MATRVIPYFSSISSGVYHSVKSLSVLYLAKAASICFLPVIVELAAFYFWHIMLPCICPYPFGVDLILFCDFLSNYSIYLIVSRLRFKSTKPDFTGFAPPILTVSALSKRPFFTYCKNSDFPRITQPDTACATSRQEDFGIIDIPLQTDLGIIDSKRAAYL